MASHPNSFGDPIVALLLGSACSLALNPQNFDYKIEPDFFAQDDIQK